MTLLQICLVIAGEAALTAVVVWSIYESVKKAGEERSWNKFDILCFTLVYVLVGSVTSLGITILYALHNYY